MPWYTLVRMARWYFGGKFFGMSPFFKGNSLWRKAFLLRSVLFYHVRVITTLSSIRHSHTLRAGYGERQDPRTMRPGPCPHRTRGGTVRTGCARPVGRRAEPMTGGRFRAHTLESDSSRTGSWICPWILDPGVLPLVSTPASVSFSARGKITAPVSEGPGRVSETTQVKHSA